MQTNQFSMHLLSRPNRNKDRFSAGSREVAGLVPVCRSQVPLGSSNFRVWTTHPDDGEYYPFWKMTFDDGEPYADGWIAQD
jgi:hypothetical protein